MKVLIIALFLLVPLCLATAGAVRQLQGKHLPPAVKRIWLLVGAAVYIWFTLSGEKLLLYMYELFQERFFIYSFFYLCYVAVLDVIRTIVLLILLHKKPRIRYFTLPLAIIISWLLAKLIPR